ncbi:MAG: hypothetical protein IKX14_06395 [Neisseriaceae bacterium]|nr:hypothetical protein [Neisseriaceae bacterium]
MLKIIFRLPESTSRAGNSSLRADSRRVGNLLLTRFNLLFMLPETV